MSSFEFNLGQKSLNYKVSGSRRFKYFCPAKSVPYLTSCSTLSLTTTTTTSQEQHTQEQQTNRTKEDDQLRQEGLPILEKENSCSKKEYKDEGAQTENYMEHLTESEKQRIMELVKEREIKKRIELEREKRRNERKEQENALPPLKDSKGIEAYRRFLEENERKDFQLREKELDDEIERKLTKVKEDLNRRFGNHIISNKNNDNPMGQRDRESRSNRMENEHNNPSRLPTHQVTTTQVENQNCVQPISKPCATSFNGSMDQYSRMHTSKISRHKREPSKRKKQQVVRSLEIVESSFSK